jgi:hypothetical protein
MSCNVRGDRSLAATHACLRRVRPHPPYRLGARWVRSRRASCASQACVAGTRPEAPARRARPRKGRRRAQRAAGRVCGRRAGTGHTQGHELQFLASVRGAGSGQSPGCEQCPVAGHVVEPRHRPKPLGLGMPLFGAQQRCAQFAAESPARRSRARPSKRASDLVRHKNRGVELRGFELLTLSMRTKGSAVPVDWAVPPGDFGQRQGSRGPG